MQTPHDDTPEQSREAQPSSHAVASQQSSHIAAPEPSSRARAFVHAVAVVAFYSVIFTIFFSPALFTGKLLAPGDGSNFHVPFFYAGRTLWQPLLWGGYPLAADPQAMTWYPLALLFSLVPRSYNAFVVSAYVLASAFAYGYVRSLTRSVFASLAGGLVYGMSAFLVAQLGHLSLVHTAAWVPAIFWSLEELRRRESAFWFAASALAVACAGLAGHFQIYVYALGLAVVYIFVVGWTPGARRLRRLGLMLASLALGVAATAVQLVPTFELTEQGQRACMSFDDFVSFSLPLRHLVRAFFPYAFGGSPGSFYATPYFDVWGAPVGGWGATELSIYVGVLPLVLALVGMATHRRERVAWFWTGVVIVALLLAAGDATPLARFVFRLPAYNKFRVPARHLFEFALATSALAGLGVASIRRRLASVTLVRRAVLICAAALASCFVALFVMTDRLRLEATHAGVMSLSYLPWHNPAALVPLVIFVAAAAALLVWSARPDSRARQAILFVVLCLDLASFGWFYEWRYVSPDASAFAPPAIASRYAEELRAAGQRMLPVRGVLNTPEGLPPNVSALWRVPSAGGYSALILARTSRLLDMSNDGNVAAPWQDDANRSLDLFAVRYVFAPREEKTSDAAGATKLDAQGMAWDEHDLNVSLGAGCGDAHPNATEFTFDTPAPAVEIAFVTALACSTTIVDDAPVLRVTATDDSGNASTQILLRAGADTAEWAHDCDDVRPTIAHRRATIFSSFTVARGAGSCEGHAYVARTRFDHALKVKRLQLEWVGGRGAVDVKKISLLDETSGRATFVRASDRAIDPARWRRVEDAGGVSIYENLRARPRAWLALEVLTLPADVALASIKTGRLPDGRTFDPARTALIEEQMPLANSTTNATNAPPQAASPTTKANDAENNAARDAHAGVSITQSSDTSSSVRVHADADSFLILSDVYYPGWRASLDGRDVHIYLADYALRGIAVPAGEHTVEFAFAPQSLRVGALISALAVIVIAFIAWWLARRERVEAS
jgi:hypothetical protein